MFLFLARQLLGLKNIDDPLFSRRYYLLEVNKTISFILIKKNWNSLEFKYGPILYSCC